MKLLATLLLTVAAIALAPAAASAAPATCPATFSVLHDDQIGTPWHGFPTAVAWLFRVWAVTTVVGALWRLGDVTFLSVASLAGSIVSLVLVVAGRYERALLVGIFVTQVFAFVTSQFGAVFGLGVDLALLWMLATCRQIERSGLTCASPSPSSPSSSSPPPPERRSAPWPTSTPRIAEAGRPSR